PFITPAFNRGYLASLQTKLDDDGVCLQNTLYTCGPAASVTALGRLGFSATEGEIAILAHTSRFAGTEPDVLRSALLERFGKEGLTCDYRYYKSIKDLESDGVYIARMKHSLFTDHYVAVLSVTPSNLV